jgi:hypothetical protein
VQAVQPPTSEDPADERGPPSAMGTELAKAREGGGLPAGWTASELLTVKVPAHYDLSRCLPVCVVWGAIDFAEIEALPQWF